MVFYAFGVEFCCLFGDAEFYEEIKDDFVALFTSAGELCAFGG